MTIYEHNGVRPTIGESVFIAPNATIIGDVTLGDESSVWFGAVLRGDVVGERVFAALSDALRLRAARVDDGLLGGFAGGLWWLDSLIRRRHGGFRIY